jgi:hypothetical protein
MGSFIVGGTLFVPIAALLAGAGFQLKHKDPGIAPAMWVFGASALVLAFLVYPVHFDSIAQCDAIAAGASSAEFRRALGITDDSRIRALEEGCYNLPFYTMPPL